MVKFGTGGWRAIIGEEFTKENIQKLALAICLKMKEEGVENQGVVMGYGGSFQKRPSYGPAKYLETRESGCGL